MKAAFTPFGAGSRGESLSRSASLIKLPNPFPLLVCIGLHLARMGMRHATARFFLAYPKARISKLEDMSDEDMKPLHFFLMFPKKKRCLMQLY